MKNKPAPIINTKVVKLIAFRTCVKAMDFLAPAAIIKVSTIVIPSASISGGRPSNQFPKTFLNESVIAPSERASREALTAQAQAAVP